MKEYHIQCEKGDLGKYVLLTGDPARCKYIASFIDDPKEIAKNREFVSYSGYISGEKVGILSTGIGGPSAAIAVEEAVHTGADTFIRIGSAGGINLKVKGGDEVIATGAVRQEGTTLHYAPIEYPAVADFSVVLALTQAADEECKIFHTGVVQSKDSFYGQHSPEKSPVSYDLINKWEAYKKLGVLCSEMECAAIFTAAASLNAKAGAILHVIWNKDREKEGLDDSYEPDMTSTIATAVRAIEILIENEK